MGAQWARHENVLETGRETENFNLESAAEENPTTN